jgi:hypothetical protein
VSAARDPRAEANALLPGRYEARVLEPSPPASTDPDWYADDPTDPAGATGPLVTPIDGEGVTWTDIAATDPKLAEYAADHWLGAHHRLEAVPGGYDGTRRALHQVAFFVVAPKRFTETGKLGLRYTHRGFGTPFFGSDRQVRIGGDQLIRQQGNRVHTAPITTIRAAARFLDLSYRQTWFDGFHDPPGAMDPDAHLVIDRSVTGFVGEWFGFATSVLEQMRRTPGAADVSRVQLWPEHFDAAVEMGAGDQRASYGASPGDTAHPEPYLYVAAWGAIDRSDPYWNDTGFNGASLSYQDLLASTDQRATAIEFLRRGHERLNRH